MRNLSIVLGVIIVLLSVLFLLKPKIENSSPATTSQQDVATQPETNEQAQTTMVAENLDTPWALAFLPDNNILVTERSGSVRLVENGVLKNEPVAVVANAREIGEGGLMGIALHPDFSNNNFVYLYYTYSASGDNTLNRVVRMAYQNNQLSNEQIIVDEIPGASNHNGGRIKFGPDKLLYITTGDAQDPSLSQSRNSNAGKILRVTDEGKAAPGNPFNSLVYSYGHRNPQGITWDSQGQLWSTEHGRSGVQSGLDELNLIEAGKNHGWPEIEGTETRAGMETPKLNSGTDSTWAPAGAAFYNNSIFFGGLRGQALYQAVTEGDKVTDFKEHFKGEYGRIREVILGPDNMLYITTSNKDGRGNPAATDDRVIKINPQTL